MKTQFRVGSMKAYANLAAYYAWYEDIQRLSSTPAIIQNGARRIGSGITDAANAHISGIEYEGGLTPIPGLDITGFFAYNRAKYTSFIDNFDRTNEPFPLAPKFSGGATARYSWDMGDIGKPRIQLNYFGTAKFMSQSGTGYPIFTINPAYNLLNARVELNDIGGKGLSAAVFVNNLTNERYLTASGTVPAVGTAVKYPGAPRMFGVSLSYRFGNE